MQFELFNEQASKVWKRVSSEIASRQSVSFHQELAFYKKYINYFQVGNSCFFIFNFQLLEFEYISQETQEVLGYDPAEVSTRTIMENVHPEDREWFIACQDAASSFGLALPREKKPKYKLQYDYHVKKPSGEYIRILHQAIVIDADEENRITRTLIVLTDISHIKPSGKPSMSYIGMDGEPSYINVDVNKPFQKCADNLTLREREILKLLTQGKSSKMIASDLKIAEETVNKHRKNMLQKKQLANTGELIARAIREGWL